MDRRTFKRKFTGYAKKFGVTEVRFRPSRAKLKYLKPTHAGFYRRSERFIWVAESFINAIVPTDIMAHVAFHELQHHLQEKQGKLKGYGRFGRAKKELIEKEAHQYATRKVRE